MTHPITAEHLVDAASKAVTEELFRKFDKCLIYNFLALIFSISLFCSFLKKRIKSKIGGASAKAK